MCSLEFLPQLINAGVTSLKIEGRMKTPEYVAVVTNVYRKYIDLALSGEDYKVDDNDVKRLMQVFNRGGFSTGNLSDEENLDYVYKESLIIWGYMSVMFLHLIKIKDSSHLILLKL